MKMAPTSVHASSKILAAAESDQEFLVARGLLEAMADKNSSWGNPPSVDNLDITKWQVGITNNLEERLKKHRVSKENAVWMPAGSHEVASKVENYFINAKARGKPGGGKDNSNIIYAFREIL